MQVKGDSVHSWSSASTVTGRITPPPTYTHTHSLGESGVRLRPLLSFMVRTQADLLGRDPRGSHFTFRCSVTRPLWILRWCVSKQTHRLTNCGGTLNCVWFSYNSYIRNGADTETDEKEVKMVHGSNTLSKKFRKIWMKLYVFSVSSALVQAWEQQCCRINSQELTREIKQIEWHKPNGVKW